MRAAVLRAPGEAPSYDEHPAPADGATLVRITAAPIVPLDVLVASGTSYFGTPATPYVPGVQGVGVVERSASLPAGTRVFVATAAGIAPGDGTLAELCLATDVVPLSDGVPDELAAAVGLSGVAAWLALSWRGQLQPGERALVLGAGGAVGQAGIGAARALGAASVVAVARPASVGRAEEAGADVVVPLEGDADAMTDLLAEHAPYDVVLDPVWGAAATAASRHLAPGGRLVNLGGSSGDEASFSSAGLRSRSAAVLGYTNNAITAAQREAALTAVLGLSADGRLRVAHDVLPLAEVASAWSAVADGTATSRIVLRP